LIPVEEAVLLLVIDAWRGKVESMLCLMHSLREGGAHGGQIGDGASVVFSFASAPGE
jgi:hypothetical protein